LFVSLWQLIFLNDACSSAGIIAAELINMEIIVTFLLRDRARAGNLARAAIFSGGWLLIASALGTVLIKAFSAPILLAGKVPPTSLDEMFPDVPLFWVPEGPLGYGLAGLLLLGGIWLAISVNRRPH
jgi:hypothetical protein